MNDVQLRDLLASDSDEGSGFSGFSDFEVDSDGGDVQAADLGLGDYRLDQCYSHPWLRRFAPRTPPGPIGFTKDSTPYDIFSSIITDDVITLLVTETNRYAKQTLDAKKENLGPHSRLRQWRPVNNPEMRAFLAVLLAMGIVVKPNYELFWTTNPLIETPGIRNVMTRDRFTNILGFMHLNNNDAAPPRDSAEFDKLHKIRPLIDLLVPRWQEVYQLDRELSVDESIIAFKGRSSFKVYKPLKPNKWGFNGWTLAESKSGYVYNWQLYSGKEEVGPLDREQAATHRVVMRLLDPVKEKAHHVYMDNYFSAPNLFAELADLQIGACGTLRVNRRGVPDAIKRGKPKKGDPANSVRDGLLNFIQWHDKRIVNLITTIHDSSVFQKKVRAKNPPDNYRLVQKPKAVELYTRHMGGVDRADQGISYGISLHRSLKWWKKVFLYLLQLCYFNAWVMYKHFHPEASRHQSAVFRTSICDGLLADHSRPAGKAGRRVSDPPGRLTERHSPGISVALTPAGRRSERDCVVCSDRRNHARCQTIYICNECRLPMCPYPCWGRYHSLKNYKITCTARLHKE